MVDREIKKLVSYGLERGLIEKEDAIYAANRILSVLHMDSYQEPEEEFGQIELEAVLNNLLDCALETGALEEDSIGYRDLLDTKLMACLMPRPSEVIHKFWEKYQVSPQNATEYFYKLSQDSDYIRRYRIKKDMKWVVDTEYGPLDITINLSKPEKDPKAIAAAKLAKQSSYPKCLLCKENEGYSGRLNHPARDNHRIIPITINGQGW